MTTRNEINAVDLAFVVDTTGSMSSLIQAAQNQMTAMLQQVTRAASINLCLGVVEYRDHPPQDKMLYEVYPFTADMQEAQKNIQRLQANGGGDAPEAVLDGITAACRELAWWKHSRRLIILVGDAPHMVGAWVVMLSHAAVRVEKPSKASPAWPKSSVSPFTRLH